MLINYPTINNFIIVRNSAVTMDRVNVWWQRLPGK